ncbi:MAG: SDR family oxidoreductase [Phycisphaerales bacterium]|jgi:NAD(P)-dependent dehydrogenase (short-subunit alcohol dehydrogenase family)|nr:SDR family oxidoreductase [Phycisphaerales bacterium]
MPTTFLVTGATRGIGLEFARQLSQRGDDVLATARDPKNAGELSSFRLSIGGLDVSDPISIEGLAEALAGRPIDVLINNAGVGSPTKSINDCTADELQRVFMVNSVAPMLVAKAVLPSLRLGSRKLIVNISSQLASITNNTGGSSFAYRASKTALNQLNKSLANELGPEGFTCVVVHPGWVRTDMGGPNAPIVPADSVKLLLKLIDALTPADNGKFFNNDGTVLPW